MIPAPVAALVVGACALAAFVGTPPAPELLLLGALHAGALLRPRLLPAVFALDALWIGWESAVRTPAGFRPNFDTWMHLAISRRVLEHGAFPPDAYFAGHDAAPVLSLVHQLVGGVAWLTGAPIEALWHGLTPLAAMATFAALAFAFREIFADRRVALLAALFEMVWRHPTWAFAAYPRNLGHAFTFLCLGLLVRALRRERPALAWGAGAALGLAIGSHVFTGVLAAALTGAVLAWVAVARLRAGDRSGLGLAARVVAGATLVASPWLVADLAAFASRGELPPAVVNAPPLGVGLTAELQRWLTPPSSLARPTPWRAVLWAGPILLGVVRLVRGGDRLAATYVVAATGVAVVSVLPPFRDLLLAAFTSFYVSRIVQLLPLAALAALGVVAALPSLASAAPAWRERRVLAGAAAAGLAVAALLSGVTPWRSPLPLALSPFLRQSELRSLEPTLRGRVVLTDLETAYLVPYLTGAWVTSNHPLHSNPWAYERDRHEGARAILSGRAGPGAIRRYVADHAVDFALVPVGRTRARERLVASGTFRELRAGEGWALLARVR